MWNWHIGWTWTLPTGYTKITLKRLDVTDKGVFGHLEWDNFDCVTLERHDTLIKEGTYKVTLDVSPHLGYKCPHIHVPDRDTAAGGDAGLRIHIANFENQLDGCIAVGEVRDGNAIDHSADTFRELMAKWPMGDVDIQII